MNSPFVIERAEAVAVDLNGCDSDRIKKVYDSLFQRAPSDSELAKGKEFIKSVDLQEFPQPAAGRIAAWQYGYGEYNPAAGTIREFHPLPRFIDNAYQAGEFYPDPVLGGLQLKADAGHTGDTQAVVRRWVAPIDCEIKISGTFAHEKKKGISGAIVLNGDDALATWRLRNQKAETILESIAVKKGDTLDFIVGPLENEGSEFKWSPKIVVAKDTEKVKSSPGASEWDAKTNFAAPPDPPLKPLTPWAAYAQALFFSNEFMFVD